MSFDSLPVEILQKIFDYLPPDEQLQKTLISRRWNQLTLRDYTLFLTHGRFLIDSNLLRETQRGYRCFLIEFGQFDAEYDPEKIPLLEICAKKFFLRELLLIDIGPWGLLQFTQKFREWVRSAVYLTVSVCDFYDKDRHGLGNSEQHQDFPRLKEVSWTYYAEEDDNLVPTYVLHTPTLEVAYVDWNEQSNQLHMVLNDTENLKWLGISVPKMMPVVCPNGLPALDYLKIFKSANPFQWNLEQFDLPRLTTLELYGCRVNNETIASLRHFRKLKSLFIRDAPNEINLHHIANAVPHLKQLRLFDVDVTFNPATLSFQCLEFLDLDHIMPREPVGYAPIQVDAPNLMTLRGAAHNLIGFKMIHPIRTLLLCNLYLNMYEPRLHDTVMFLHVDFSDVYGKPPKITECIHQFPNLKHLTLILHEKEQRVSLNGHLLAVSFRLSYLHLQNFDLDYDFLVGINHLNLTTLVLQDGTLTVAPGDKPLAVDYDREVYLMDVMLPSDVFSFPLLDVQTKMIDAQPEGNIFSTLVWNERKIKTAEDYVTYLARF